MCPSDDSLRQPIKFANNVVTECIYKPVNLNPTLSTFCQTLQKEIDKIILGYIEESRANRFSPFANSNQTDWKEILNTAPTLNVNKIFLTKNTLSGGTLLFFKCKFLYFYY